jgi:hypothetical protein
MLSPLSRLLHLKKQFRGAGFVPAKSDSARRNPRQVPRLRRFPATAQKPGSAATIEKRLRYFVGKSMEETRMKKALAILATVATVGATAVTAPAEARGRGFGPGLAFGLAAGALTAGAIAGAYGPYGYGPGYGYGYGPGYGYYGYDYAPAYYYGAGPYAYYGGPYYRRHRHWRHYW